MREDCISNGVFIRYEFAKFDLRWFSNANRYAVNSGFQVEIWTDSAPADGDVLFEKLVLIYTRSSLGGR
jgi:hypothetical protein